MTNTEIVDKYLTSIGMKRVSGTSLEPILPFFMLDAAYNMWLKDVQPIQCKHEAKKMKKEWVTKYGLFNRSFFRAFTLDEQCEITDKMDSFDAYIGNHVTIAKVQVMNVMRDLETEQAVRCASLLIINILCQSAQIVWQHVYKNSRNKDKTNPEIHALERLSSKFMNAYHCRISDRNVNPNESKPIVDAVDVLCNKMIKWLYVDKKASEAEAPEVTIKCG